MEGLYKKRTHDTHMNQHLPYVQDDKNNIDLVLLGDSHFERLMWFNETIKKKVPNDVFVAGVGGDKIENILYRLESKDGLIYAFHQRKNKPKKIIFMAGSNNLLLGNKPDQPERIVEKMKYVINYLRKELPTIPLEVWAIPIDKKHTKTIETYNFLLKKTCELLDCSFSEEVFLATKTKKGIFHDDIHLNVNGYSFCMLPVIHKIIV